MLIVIYEMRITNISLNMIEHLSRIYLDDLMLLLYKVFAQLMLFSAIMFFGKNRNSPRDECFEVALHHISNQICAK